MEQIVNWVLARSKCSLAAVFADLYQQLDSDIKSAQALNRPGVTFALKNEVHNKLIVSRIIQNPIFPDAPAGESVIFELAPNEINVTRSKSGFLSEPYFSAK